MSDQRDEIMRLAEAQARTETMVETLCRQMDAHTEASSRQNAELRALILSQNQNNPGLGVRVDRLEQTGKKAWWAIKGMAGALVALAAAAVQGWIGRR